MAHLSISEEQLSAFCRKHHIRKLSLFGSVLKGTAGPESDVDLLVEFQPDACISLFEVVDAEQEMSELLKRKVDLRTAADLSRYFREEVVRTAERLYGT